MRAGDLLALSDSSTATKPGRFRVASSRAASSAGVEKATGRPAGTRPGAYDPRRPGVGSRLRPQHAKPLKVGIVAGATRAGATHCAFMMRSHDDDLFVVGGADLVPELLELLRSTLEDDA